MPSVFVTIQAWQRMSPTGESGPSSQFQAVINFNAISPPWRSPATAGAPIGSLPRWSRAAALRSATISGTVVLQDRIAPVVPSLALSAVLHVVVLIALQMVGGQVGWEARPAATRGAPRILVTLNRSAEPVPRVPSPASIDGRAAAPTPPASLTEAAPPSPDSSEGALVSLPDDTYYTSAELDTRPIPVTDIELDTGEARRLAPHTIGKIILELRIDQFGRVERATPLETDMSDAVTGQAVAAFSNARFQPATRKGKAVRAISVVEINYDAGTGNTLLPPAQP